ncbi:MAG TPA: 2-dehydropantoate 2-reductase [Candidatus Baltobacteraceae bacterium]|jgi:2-dehydropantoate 2-reductase
MAMRILVVGAGAVGGYFGGRLAQAGRDVTFLVRDGRAAVLRTNGLEIVSPHGDAKITPGIVTKAELNEPYGLVLLAVKQYALESAIGEFAPAIGPDTVILPVLNGVRHIDLLSAKFGRSHVLGGVCIVATTLDEKGRIVQLREMQELTYGELDGSNSARVLDVDRSLQGAGFTARLSSSIELEMWEKWVFIATLGTITCLLRGSVGQIARAPRGRDLTGAAIDECVSVATAAGYAPRAPALERIRTTLTDPDSNLTSSLYRDLQSGAKLEADAIIGDMCVRGEAAGVKLPLLAAAYAQLSIAMA